MQDFTSIGPAPAEEPPVKLGSLDCARLAKQECRQFIEAIRGTLGQEPEGARLSVKDCPHAFGTYYDVVCYFDTDYDPALNYALMCESDAPASWEESGLRSPKKSIHER